MMKYTLMAPKWIIKHHFQNGETTYRQLSKRLPDNSTIFAAEATAISLALNYYQHMGPVNHDVVIYSDSMSCLQATEGEDTESPFICHIMNLLWLLREKGTHICFCRIPSHCGIEGNESVDQLAKEALDQNKDPPASVHYTDMKPLVNIQSEIGSNQVGCSCTWQRSLSRETNIRATKEIPAPNQGWRGCNHFELVRQRPPNLISCPEDRWLFGTIVVKHWLLAICSWSVQCYRSVVMNTTELNRWILSSKQFLRLA